MLNELKVSDFAIIDRIHVTFRGGFNVLSGETGSGKSVLLKSLALLMGEKSVNDAIKSGAESATVEGAFDLADRPDIKAQLVASGISDATAIEDVDDTLVVKRVMSRDGKNRVYINGSLSTLQQLREIVAPLIEVTGHPAPLIEMTGQHENRHLQSKTYHLETLDQSCGTVGLRRQVSDLFQARAKLIEERTAAEALARNREQRLDFLTFQRDEIRAADLQSSDEESLTANLQLQKESKKLLDFISVAESSLYSDDESALVRLHRVLSLGSAFAGLDADLARHVDLLGQAKTLVEDAVYQLRDYGQKFSQDPAGLEEMEGRLSQIRKLQKKYGGTTESILKTLVEIESEIAQIERSDERLEELDKQISAHSLQMKKLATDLHSKRRKGAGELAKAVNHELADLNMKGLIFSVRVSELDELAPTGLSDVEFQIQNSKSDEPRSLARFASGGELSRILLALKRAAGDSDRPRTYLFDEVDAGVSGVTAEKVGRKLAQIARGGKKSQQVICVTHLPQVAAFAQAHFVIQKVGGGSTKDAVKMTVSELTSTQRVREIARMLSGEKITKSSLVHAGELLKQ